MDCLNNYIGLTGCGNLIPASGLFINSLPGISLKSVEQLADAEQQNYIGVWNDVQLRALKRLELSVISELAKEYKLKATKYTINTQYENALVGGAPTVNLGTLRASILIKTNCYSELNSNLVKSLFVQTPTIPQGCTVSVWDYETKIFLDSFSLTISSSVTEIPINKKYYQHNILLEITTNTNIYYSNLELNNIYSDCADILFGTSNMASNVDFVNTNKCYGIRLLYSNKCDFSNIVCYNKEVFALPLWYLLGSELMMERMVSDRINKYTVDKKQAEELKAYYDAEFDKALKQAISGISLVDCDCCLECDPLIAIKEALP